MIGGNYPETDLKTVKLASAHYYDELPTEGNEHGQAFRDVQLEQENCWKRPRNSVFSAQFGGKYWRRHSRYDAATSRRILPGGHRRSPAPLTVTLKRKSTAKVSGSKNWNTTQASTFHELRQAGEGEAVKVDLDRPDERDPSPSFRNTRYPLVCRSPAPLSWAEIAHAKLKVIGGEELHGDRRSPDLLRGSGENPCRLSIRFTWPNHRRPYGLLSLDLLRSTAA